MGKRVIIIGAGPAGLTAARELLDADNTDTVTVLEEADCLGGISRTVRYHGNRMDIGGHRFFSKSSEVTRRWEALMPLQGAPARDDLALGRIPPLSSGGPDPEQVDRVMLVRERVSRIYYHQRFFNYPLSLNLETFRSMGAVATLRAGCSYLAALLHKRPEHSLEDFYINRFGRVLYEMFFEGYTEKLWGRHPREISADWGAQRVKGVSLRALLRGMLLPKQKNQLVETSLIEQFWYPKQGPGQLWEALGKEIQQRGGALFLQHQVTGLLYQQGKITAVLCQTPEGPVTLEGDVFFSSMPLKDLVLGLQGQSVPQSVLEIARGLPYRDFVTVGLLVRRLGLKSDDVRRKLVPDCWIYVQEPGVRLGRIQIFNNWSPYMVADPDQTVWMGLEYFCQEGDAFWNQSEEDCVQFAVNELVKMGVISPEDVLDAHRERVKKAYPAYFDTYDRIDQLVQYVDGIENLYCIGRNGQHRYNNMDHSMLTAIRAVESYRSGGSGREKVWQVNTESAYHEEGGSL